MRLRWQKMHLSMKREVSPMLTPIREQRNRLCEEDAMDDDEAEDAVIPFVDNAAVHFESLACWTMKGSKKMKMREQRTRVVVVEHFVRMRLMSKRILQTRMVMMMQAGLCIDWWAMERARVW
jgi:hypothetical protein